MKQELRIAARELVHHTMRSGDLAFEFLGPARPVEAIRAHQNIQNSRPDTYQAEVPISYHIETDQFLLTIGGRIDGVFTEPERVVIEEIKTTARSLEYVAQNEEPLHWGQLKTYAYMYASQFGLDQIDAQLTYYQIDHGEMREFKNSFAVVELEEFFKDLVERYLQWAVTMANWCRWRDDSILNLGFPFPAYRPGQRTMAVAVYRTIKNDGQLLIQAATGIGKTMAVVFPALKILGETRSSKIFYLTARTTGRTVAEKALNELRHRGLKLKSLTLTAKDKICFNPQYACHPDECEYAKGHYDRVDDALKEIFHQDAFTRDVILEAARTHRVCPFEFSLDLSLWADFIICDYNYAFDPRVFLRRFFQEENDDYTFLIDEAHNLVDRSREMFSAEIFKQPILAVRRLVKNNLPQIYKSLGKINSWLVKARRECEATGQSIAQKDAPHDLFPLLRRFMHLTENWLSLNIKTSYREALLELFFAISGFLRVADQYDDSYTTCYEKIDKDLKIKLFCIDPSGHLNHALKRCHAAIFFSATMTPISYFKTILGCEDHADRLILPSPFPRENFGVFVSHRVSTLYRQRHQTKSEVTKAILTFVTQHHGNFLLYFPSYEYMLMVYDLFQAECSQIDTIIQTPGMSESERDAFLERFAQQNPETLVGFAVMGGIFGEGIDLVGNRLSGAAVVGVGLPAISLENELIRHYFEKFFNAGFEFAYLYPGINRVLQAAGRVIRTEEDRGVVLLIDQRYATARYRSLLPEHWRPIQAINHQQLAEDLQAFWMQ
ncbi:MAG: helicase C-terminal domain-containing protein [Desulfobacterales bacterium]